MNDGQHVFVDIYGTGRRRPSDGGPHPDGPFWKRAILGREALWKVFWGGFVFGHGFLIAFGLGFSLFSLATGLALEPMRFSATFASLMAALAVVSVVTVTFVLWAVISVWRCSKNVLDRRWTYTARAVVAVYLCVWSLPLWHLPIWSARF